MPDKQRETTAAEAVPVIVVLSGPHRGHTTVLTDKVYRIILQPDEALLILGADEERAAEYHASLHRISNTYEISMAPEHDAWVDGERIRGSRVLKSGDVVEVGHGGPLFRYRLYPPGMIPRKTITEAVVDSIHGAHADGRTRWGRMSRLLANLTRELATQTTLWFRFWVLVVLTVVVISIAILVIENLQLQKRVVSEETRIENISEILEQRGAAGLNRQELLVLQEQVKTQLADTLKRLEQLEKGPGKAAGVIAAATPSVVFLLGAYGYAEPGTGRFLRYEETDKGITRLTMEGEGKLVELVFTGTAFVVTKTGMLLTNRHVVEPWQDDKNRTFEQGRHLQPEVRRILAYFPDRGKAVEVEIERVGDTMDIALLRPARSAGEFVPLEFESRTPSPGEEVLLLGYPTGMRALVARASAEFIESITGEGAGDYWTVAQRLSDAGYIKPLASRGIVGQIGEEFINYDAETTFGGSGGPVLDSQGYVIAINTAIIPEFGGANMGIPAVRIQQFLKVNMPAQTAAEH